MKKYLLIVLLIASIIGFTDTSSIKRELSHIPISGKVCFNAIVLNKEIQLFCREKI